MRWSHDVLKNPPRKKPRNMSEKEWAYVFDAQILLLDVRTSFIDGFFAGLGVSAAILLLASLAR